MITRWRLVLATIGAASLMVVACGDDDDDGTGGGTTTTGTTQTGSGGSGGTQTGTTTGGGGSGGGGEMTCDEGCNALFDCGLEDGNCPGMAEDQRDIYLNGCDGSSGCIVTCGAMPALLTFIDPADCAGTVETISGMSEDFAAVCADGAGGCGGGGGGA